MKRTPLIVVIVLAVLVVGLGTWLLVRLLTPPAPSVNSYAECVAAGYPILEIYPEQCRTPDGRTFTNPDSPPLTPAPTTGEFTSEGGVPVTVDDWTEQPVTSPLTLSGEVPGTWAFEASFPVQLVDAEGRVLGEAAAQLEGDWMTDEMVPFSVTVEFENPPSGSADGFLVLVKENASGMPEHDDTVRIPVTFA